MECANTSMLNKFLADQEKKEAALERFEKSIDDRLVELQNIIRDIKVEAQNFEGYCFTDDLEDYLKDLL
jgi:hypothetical protein